MKRIPAIIILLLWFMNSTIAQQTLIHPLPQEKLNDKIFGQFLAPDSEAGWIKFSDQAPYTANEIFIQQPEILGMRSEDEMRIWKVNTDVVGNLHYKYVQYYKGVRVEGIEHIVHERSGRVYLMNGDFISDLNINVTPSISGKQAVDILLQNFPAERYLWQDEKAEQNFKKKKKDPNATLYPTPELLIVKKDGHGEMIADNYVLAYRMYLFSENPHHADYVFVDAHTGEVIRTRTLEINCSPGTAETTFNGTQTVYTKYTTDDCDYDQQTVTDYFSWDDCNTDTEIKSWYVHDFYGDYFKCDENNVWDEGYDSDDMTISSLWGARQAYSYYYNTWGHESFDGSSGLIDVYSNREFTDANGDPYCSNARYVSILDNIEFGSGPNCSPGDGDDYNTDDIIGHEYTHGVIEYAHFDALDYSDESGALNESFADIFGEAVERYIEGDNDWWSAFDRFDLQDNHYPIRCFSNPDTGSMNDPDTYLGTYWYSGSDDNGGVHTNSGVQNHLFYLLAEGGTGTNSLGWNYNVTGIGFPHAIAIAWQAMMQYLDGSDGYITARNAWIQSAIDLYGSCSQDVISVGQAFSAAGVTHYTSYALGSICGTYSSAILTVIDGAEGIKNSSTILYNWLTDCTATVSSTGNVYAESGNYVQLVPGFTATSGCTFTAAIDPCEASDYNPNDLRMPQTAEQNFNQLSVSNLKIYPVPADNLITIEYPFEESTAITISVIDISGKEVVQWVGEEAIEGGIFKKEFNTSLLMSGMYVCLLKTDKGTIQQKFIVQH